MTTSSDDDSSVDILPPAQRDGKGGLLPGQRSINPKGRPPIIKDIKDAAKSHTRQALNTLISVMNDPDCPAASRVTAAEAILNRGWGRPLQNVEARVEVTDVGATAAGVLMELSRKAREHRAERELEEQRQPGMIDVTPVSSTLN